MNVTIRPVRTPRELEVFVRFPWKIYRGDPYWVPPLLSARRERLDPARNPFWQTVERELWLAWRGEDVVGSVAAFWPKANVPGGIGNFGFFESINDPEPACLLFETACQWLRQKGAGMIRGPYNPSPNDETGVLVDGFESRPAVMQGHNPRYYSTFFEKNGFSRHIDLMARLFTIPPEVKTPEEVLPPRLSEVAKRAARRTDVRVRRLEPKRWEEEIHLACDLYNAAMADVPEVIPIPQEEFRQLADGFRPILNPDLALIAEVGGKPAGFALALPDVNEAFQALNGRSGPLEMLRLLWAIRRLKRVCFKILVILPEFQGRGIEAVLIHDLCAGILKHNLREVDMSLTGDDNEKSTRFQEHLGFHVYRRYRVYQKDLSQ